MIYGNFGVIISEDFVKSVAPQAYEDILQMIKTAYDNEDASFHDLASALYYDDKIELEDTFEDKLEEFDEKLQLLYEEFKSNTGLTLSHIYFDENRDMSTELEHGHYFALDFHEVYATTPAGKKLNDEWDLHVWARDEDEMSQ